MVTKISFENDSNGLLGVIIEPEAANFDLSKKASLDIEFVLKTNQYNDKIEMVMQDKRIIIYECRQYEMKIFIDGDLMYNTPEGRYW